MDKKSLTVYLPGGEKTCYETGVNSVRDITELLGERVLIAMGSGDSFIYSGLPYRLSIVKVDSDEF